MPEARTELLTLAQCGSGLSWITGPNGSGKSSAARVLAAEVIGARLLSAESQQAFFEAELASDDSNFAQGADTTSSVKALLGEGARVHALFSAFRLEPLWERRYRQLSTGEARKVLLLQAVLASPPILILDDPFDGLDRAARADLAQVIADVAQQLHVVVVGTFEAETLPFPPELFREVLLISRGQVLFRGSAHAFFERERDRARRRAPPPVELKSLCEPVDPDVPLVDLRDGSVRYAQQVVFEHLDFEVRVGPHTLIEGPNGSGKSSLLEMITGDHPQAYNNDLRLFGRRRGSGESVWDIKRQIGLVSARLHRDYRVGGSVEEVLLSGLFDSIGVYQRVEPSHRARARAWLSWLELGLPGSTPFRELSFGQQRLVLVARAAIKLPPLVVFDEPTSGLDDENRARVLELAESLCTQHISTLLMVTHRADERAFWDARIRGPVLSLPR